MDSNKWFSNHNVYVDFLDVPIVIPFVWKQKNVQMNYWCYKYMSLDSSYPMLQHVGANIGLCVWTNEALDVQSVGEGTSKFTQ